MSNLKKDNISFKLSACSCILRDLLDQIKYIENDEQSSIEKNWTKLK